MTAQLIEEGLNLARLYAVLGDCRGESFLGLGYETEKAMLKATGLSDEQIYARWMIEADWLAFGDEPGQFAQMVIDKPLWSQKGDQQHLLIEAVDSNPEWLETFNEGIQEIDEWRRVDVLALQANLMGMANDPEKVDVLDSPKNRETSSWLTAAKQQGLNLLMQSKTMMERTLPTLKQLMSLPTRCFGMASRWASAISGRLKIKLGSL